MRKPKNIFRKDDDLRRSWSGATWTAKCRPQYELGGVHPVGFPPNCNAILAWVLRFINHLALQRMAGVVLDNGSMSSNQSSGRNVLSTRLEWATESQGLGSQRNIRLAFIEADLVNCMVALPGHSYAARTPQTLDVYASI